MIGKLYTSREKKLRMTEQLIGWTLDVTFMWQPEKNQCFTSQHPARQREGAHQVPSAGGDHLFLWHMIAAAAQIMSFHLPLVVLSLSGLVFVRAGLCCCDFLSWKEKKKATQNRKIIQQQSIVIMTLWWLPVFVLYSLLFASTGFLTLHRK